MFLAESDQAVSPETNEISICVTQEAPQERLRGIILVGMVPPCLDSLPSGMKQSELRVLSLAPGERVTHISKGGSWRKN